jgi:hypothetical protein
MLNCARKLFAPLIKFLSAAIIAFNPLLPALVLFLLFWYNKKGDGRAEMPALCHRGVWRVFLAETASSPFFI